MRFLSSFLLAALLWGAMPHPAAGQQANPQVSPEEELRQIADRLFAERRFDEAQPIYLRLLETLPRDFAINRNLGYCFSQGSRPDLNRAIQYFNAALAIEPSEEVQIELARVYVRARRAQEGLQILQNLVGQHPQHPEHWRDYAAQLDLSGQQARAIQAYRAYLERRPGDAAARLELARLLSLEVQTTEALAEYRIVLQSDPRSIPGRLGMARLLAWQNRFPESLQLYDEVLAESPQNGEAQQGKAQVLVWLGRLEEAERLFRSLASRYPNNPEIRAALNDIQERRQLPPAAVVAEPPPETVESYQSRVAQNPNDREARLWLGEYYAAQQQWSPAVEQYREAVRLQSDDPTLFRLGQLLSRSGSFQEAAQLLQEVQQRSPSPDVALEWAAALRWSGRSEEALPLLDGVLAELPDNADALRHRAHANASVGKYPEAVRDFDRLLALRSDDSDALIGKATAIANQGDFAAALALLESAMPRLAGDPEVTQVAQRLNAEWKERQEQARRITVLSGTEGEMRLWLETHPDDADIAYNLGELAAQRGNYAEAIHFLHVALEADPQMRPARLRLAQMLSFNGSYADAVTEYDRLLREDPNDLQPLWESARVLSWSQRYPESAARYNRYLQTQPDPDARFQLAQVYFWNAQYNDALRELDRLLQVEPESREVMLERGRALAYLGRYPEALSQYDQALSRFPSDIELLYVKGQALYWAGELEEADRVLSQVHQQAPDRPDATFALASVAAARGYTGRALRLVPEDTQHPESRNLRANILDSLRPELQLGFSGEHGTELQDVLPDAGLRYYRGSALLGFWMTPEIRAQVQFDSVPSFADRNSFLGRLGDSFVSNSLMFSASGRLHPSVRWRVGAGGYAQTSGAENLLYLASLGFQVIPNSTLTLEANRLNIDYTPRAVALNVRRYEYRAQWDTRIADRFVFSANYTRGNFSTGNHSNSGQTFTEMIVPLTAGQEIGVGYRFYILGFTRSTNGGFFTPEHYEQHLVTARLSGQLRTSALRYDLFGALGPQNSEFFNGDPTQEKYTLSGNIGTTLTWNPTEHHSLGGGYTFSNTALVTGAYRSHGFYTFWRMRF